MIHEYVKSFSGILLKTEVTDQAGNVLDHSRAIEGILADLQQVRNAVGTVFLIGNGGSSGIVSHASVDLINMCKVKAVPLTDNSQLTCMANDYGYENVFSVPLQTMFTGSDVLIAVSSSGASENIVRAAKVCQDKEGLLITFSGFKPDNPLRALGKYNFWLDSADYGKVEIGHALLLHLLAEQLA